MNCLDNPPTAIILILRKPPEDRTEFDRVTEWLNNEPQREWLLVFVRRVLRRCGGIQLQEAEDILQDFFLDGLRKVIEKFDFNKGELKNYLCKSLQNFTQRKGNKLKRILEKQHSFWEESKSTSCEIELAVEDASTDPQKNLENKRLGETLVRALDRLPRKQRDVLILRDVMGYSASETGDFLGLDVRYVHVLLLRAHQEMRKVLQRKVKRRTVALKVYQGKSNQ